MTKLLEKALEAVRRLPPDSQDQIALAMLSLSVNDGEPEKIDPADLPAGDDPADFSHLKDKRKVPLTIANLVSHQ